MEEECKDAPPEFQHFTTLTYDDDNLPGDKGLHYDHVQAWLKRVRRSWDYYSSGKFSFFCVGEYGTESARPHWHVLTWGVEQDLLRQKWEMGNTYPGVIGTASIRYVLNYLDKPMYDELKIDPEFQGNQEMRRMSNGIGDSFLWKLPIADAEQYFKEGQLQVRLNDGTKLQMPRYYRTKLEESMCDDDDMERITQKRIILSHENMEKYIKHLNDKGLSLADQDEHLRRVFKTQLHQKRKRSKEQ